MNSGALKVVLIGPNAERHRGGIAQFTSRLAAELSGVAPLHFVSWRELYPRLLASREQTNIGRTTATESLDYSNPLTWMGTARSIAKLDPTHIFFSWSHPIHAPIYRYLIKRLRQRTKAELVGVCHNVFPHENFPGAKRLSRDFFASLDRVIVHGDEEATRFESLKLKAKLTVLYMPTFDVFPIPKNIPSTHENHILFFGNIRPYKGLEVLLEAMPRLLEVMPELKLKIAGENFSRSLPRLLRMFSRKKVNLERLISRARLGKSVELDSRYIPDDEVAGVFSNAAAVIFPFHSCTGSASLSLALALGKPVVATNVGSLAAVIKNGVNGVLVPPNDPAALAEGILQILEQPPKKEEILAANARFSWSAYARLALELPSAREALQHAA